MGIKPITFQCTQTIARPATAIAAEIADTARWREFRGYGILPGIDSAEYETQTADMVGSRIHVRNTDGSEHVEEIYRWVPGEEIAMKLHEFTPPLGRLATHFTEEWRFQVENGATRVTRKFEMFPTRSTTRPAVWFISLFFRRAIARHLAEMAAGS